MSVWIGDLGGMVETPCLSGLSVTTDDRSVHGGGAGTLTGPFTVAWGGGRRSWSCTIGVKSPSGLAALETLAYRQHVYGVAGYRMLACDAHNTNAFTPRASLDFTGWGGNFSVSTVYTAALEQAGGGTILYPDTPLEARTPIEGGPPVTQVESVAAITVTAASSATLTSPIVPVRPGHPVTLGIFGQGSVLLRARWVDAAGNDGALATVTPSVTHAGLQRVAGSAIAPANAAGVRLVVSGGIRYAWPSITWTAGPRRFATGRGAESVHLSPVDESVIMATREQQLSGFQYTIREVAA